MSEPIQQQRPGFFKFIKSELEHDEEVRAFGFWFHDPGKDNPHERYAMLIRFGMTAEAMADALEKLAHQMRTRTGANDQEGLEGNEVNAADFPPGKPKEDL